jgi:hypothetical protein
MKRLFSQSLAVALVAGSLTLNAFAEAGTGEVDFGRFTAPGNDGTFVEINVGRNLISLAAKLVDGDNPDAAKLLRSIQLIHVNVVGLSNDNRSDTEKRVRDIRSRLEKEGWERIVTAQEKNGGDVGIHIKARGEESFEGIVVTVLDGKKEQAVFINIVGDIKPEQIAAVGKALHIDPLSKVGESIKK